MTVSSLSWENLEVQALMKGLTSTKSSSVLLADPEPLDKHHPAVSSFDEGACVIMSWCRSVMILRNVAFLHSRPTKLNPV